MKPKAPQHSRGPQHPLGPVLLVGLALCAAVGAGCHGNDATAGYTNRSLYRDDIRTVCVEMFGAQTFRRGIEFDLTRALVQQLELHSPYKVVADRAQADTVLYGTITDVNERPLAQQRDLDRPIENRITLVAQVTWKDLRNGEMLLDGVVVRVAAEYLQLLGAGRDSAQREAANEMAVRIVEAMESDW